MLLVLLEGVNLGELAPLISEWEPTLNLVKHPKTVLPFFD
jgi:hypothetical protein